MLTTLPAKTRTQDAFRVCLHNKDCTKNRKVIPFVFLKSFAYR